MTHTKHHMSHATFFHGQSVSRLNHNQTLCFSSKLSPVTFRPSGEPAHKERRRTAPEPPAHSPQAFHPGSHSPHPARGEGPAVALRQLQGLQRRLRRRRDERPLPPE